MTRQWGASWLHTRRHTSTIARRGVRAIAMLLLGILSTGVMTGLAMGLAPHAAWAASANNSAATANPTVQLTGCSSDLPVGTECGTLTTLENAANPASRTITVPFVRHRVAVAKVAKPPVAYLAGRATAVTTMKQLLADKVFPDRDLIVVEPRGGATSSTAFTCPAAPAALLDYIAKPGNTAALTRENTSAYSAILRNCIDVFAKSGADINGYTLDAAGADLVQLRTAMAYPAWFVVGSDWTAPIAEFAASKDPKGVKGVILDAPIAANAATQRDAALSEALEYAGTKFGNSDTKQHGTEPDLLGALRLTIATLNATPATVTTTNPITGDEVVLTVDGADVPQFVQSAMSDTQTAPIMAQWLGELATSDPRAVTALVQKGLPNLTTGNLGLQMLYSCRQNAGTPVGNLLRSPADTKLLCDTLKIAGEKAPMAPTQPVLAFVSAANPLSPAALTAAKVSKFVGGSVMRIDSSDARTALKSACVNQWLTAPSKAVKFAPCEVKSSTAQPVAVASASRAAPELALGAFNIFSLLLIPFTFALVAPVWTLAWVGNSIAAVFRRRAHLGTLLTGITPVASLIFVAIAGRAVYDAMQSNSQVFLVGVPAAVPAASWILIPALVGCYAFFHYRRWFDGILATIAVCGFSAWFAWAVLNWW